MGKIQERPFVLAAKGSKRFDNNMGQARRLALRGATALALALTPALAHAQAQQDNASKPGKKAAKASSEAAENDIVVTGITAPTTSSTGLALTFMQTPQSVTVIDNKRIQDFALTSSKELLKQVVGVNVEDLETDRTTYNARGFDITNFQIDGIGLPIIEGYTYGDTDSFLYDRIDIIRGANGLTTGIGNPSATINYVRKRPLKGFHVSGGVYAGSWGKWRGEVDISTPISDNWAVRAQYAHEQTNSYLDKYSTTRNVAGVTISGALAPDLTLTAGYNYQNNYSHAPSWIGLYLNYTDGTPISYRRSENSAPSWAVWPNTDQQAFGELTYKLGDWSIKGVVNYRVYLDDPILLNPTGSPDRATGFYLGDSARFHTNNRRLYGDLIVNGNVHAFGQTHKLTFGSSYAHSRQMGYQGRAVDTGYGLGAVLLPNFNSADRFNPAEPTYNAPQLAEDKLDTLLRLYVASQINFTDRLHMVGGASWTKLKSSGYNYGQQVAIDQSKLSPYAGLLFDLTHALTAYASYTTIFMPQGLYDINHKQLKPLDGTNLEGGLKVNLFNKKFYATATVFKTMQKGLGTLVGQVPDPVYGNFFYYNAVGTTTSKGFEVEMTGRVTPNWELSGGYTGLSIKDNSGVARARDFVPRRSLKASTTYTFPELNNLSLGAQLRWQDKLQTLAVNQDAYMILDLQAGVDIVKNMRASLVLRNVTNKLYFTSLVYGDYGIAQYAAPRSVTGSVIYKF